MKIVAENLHILWAKYGKENTNIMLSLISEPEHIENIVKIIIKLNLTYNDAFDYVKIFTKELRLLNLKCILNYT
jgi:hypothetical protein